MTEEYLCIILEHLPQKWPSFDNAAFMQHQIKSDSIDLDNCLVIRQRMTGKQREFTTWEEEKVCHENPPRARMEPYAPKWLNFHNCHILVFTISLHTVRGRREREEKLSWAEAASPPLTNCRNSNLSLLRNNTRFVWHHQFLTSSLCGGRSGGLRHSYCTTSHLWENDNAI